MGCALVLWALACGLKFRFVWAFLPLGRGLARWRWLALAVARSRGLCAWGRFGLRWATRGAWNEARRGASGATHPYKKRDTKMGALPHPSCLKKVLDKSWVVWYNGSTRGARCVFCVGKKNRKEGKSDE